MYNNYNWNIFFNVNFLMFFNVKNIISKFLIFLGSRYYEEYVKLLMWGF